MVFASAGCADAGKIKGKTMNQQFGKSASSLQILKEQHSGTYIWLIPTSLGRFYKGLVQPAFSI
jgi:hypothetical protein